MGKRKFNAISIGFAVLILLTVALLGTNSLRRSSRIVLPPPDASSSAGAEEPDGGQEAVRREVRPDAVQAAIATLARPGRYGRVLTAEYFWSGGSASTETVVRVDGGFCRVDLTGLDGRVRHSITDGQHTWIWYDSERSVYETAAGDIDVDAEQRIPTYEDILALPAEDIAAADYRSFSNIPCLYVETGERDGYVQRYWISVESGLLVGAEKLQSGETVYRAAERPEESPAVSAAAFTLPDGSVLHTVE